MPRRAKYETQLKRNKEAVPTEPQPEITRVFKEITNKDGVQHIEEQPAVSPPAPKDTLVEAEPEDAPDK